MRHILICLPLLLGGCALFSETQPGLSDFEVAADGTLSWHSGKEYGHIKGCYVSPSGAKGYIEASDVDALEGQKIFAQIHQQQANLISGVIDKLMAAAGGGMPMLAPSADAGGEPLPGAMPLPADPCVALFAGG